MAPGRPVRNVRWAKSFPTIQSQGFSYSCTFNIGHKLCSKKFTRLCDLRRHEKNHTRAFKCSHCSRGFPSPKDVERHFNSRHKLTIKYFCPYEKCRDSMGPLQDNGEVSWGCEGWSKGFKRKDHWQKHLQDEHKMSRETVGELQKNIAMPPTAQLKDEKWLAVLPPCISKTCRTSSNVREDIKTGVKEEVREVPLRSGSETDGSQDCEDSILVDFEHGASWAEH